MGYNPDMNPSLIVLSRVPAAQLLLARVRGDRAVVVSPDLNCSEAEATLTDEGARFPDGTQVRWEALTEIAAHEHGCFLVAPDGAVERVTRFSETTNRQCSLYATDGAPTLFLAGFPMHRIKGCDPWEDTQKKIAAVAPVSGRVLDTATGLGYTAIAAAQTAGSVTTIELDPTVLEVARCNPWSRPLFDNPRIQQKVGSAFDIVPTLPEGAFDILLHDPPTMQLAGELYSGVFYRALRRVTARRGRLFHYIGSPESRYGAGIQRGVVRRLHEAGFSQVKPSPEAFGVVALP